jgi:radical SAM superfamily enzyme YgiQ (UPF0313 family)
MNLLLIHAYFIHEDEVEQKVMKPYPPLGLLYISAFVEQHSIEHRVFDSTFSTFETLKKEILANTPDVIGVYANFLTRRNILRIIDFLKDEALLDQIKFVVGGPDVKYSINEYLDYGVDYAIIGEGDQTFLELINALENEADVSQIDGIAYKDDTGEIKVNIPRAHMRDLNILPFPNRKKIDLSNYLNAWKSKHGYNSITVNTQRGCSFSCNWCSHAVFGDTYRRRSAKSVVDELVEIQEDYNPDSIWFVDDVFTMSERWLNGFAEELKSRNVKISYECISRADRLNENVIKTLHDSGCEMIWIGAESGSQKVIDLMNRRVDVNQVREMIQLASKQGIRTGTFIMLGYPGETEEDINETIHHLKVANPDVFTINIAYPIRGTHLHNLVKDITINNNDWAKTIDRDVDFKRTFPRRYYDFAIRKVYNEVYAHKSKMSGDNFKTMKFKLKSFGASIGMVYFK